MPFQSKKKKKILSLCANSKDCDIVGVSPPTSEAGDYSKDYRDHHIHSIQVDHIQNAFHDHQRESEQLRGFQVQHPRYQQIGINHGFKIVYKLTSSNNGLSKTISGAYETSLESYTVHVHVRKIIGILGKRGLSHAPPPPPTSMLSQNSPIRIKLESCDLNST